MGEIKELEEARAIFDFVYAGFHGGRQPHHSLFDNFMKNLKGDGWSVAIIEDSETVWVLKGESDPDSKRVPFKQIIWQANKG